MHTPYATALMTERDELRTQLNELGTADPIVKKDWDATTGDSVTRTEADNNLVADRTEEWETRRAELESLEVRYAHVTHALQKIDAGTYGTCEICGAPVEPERLDANPAARTCVAHRNDESQLPLL